jgi:hypothetical protein
MVPFLRVDRAAPHVRGGRRNFILGAASIAALTRIKRRCAQPRRLTRRASGGSATSARPERSVAVPDQAKRAQTISAAIASGTTSTPGAIVTVTSALTGPRATLLTVPAKTLRALTFVGTSWGLA